MTIIGSGHRRFIQADLPGSVIEQKISRGTGPGVFLSLSHIYSHDSEATVVILPSDHFVYPEEVFTDRLYEAIVAAELWGRVVLLGAVPDRPETEYGWIEVGRPAAHSGADGLGRAFLVSDFHEKPEPDLAARLLNRSCLWNTMIVIAKLHDLWMLAERVNPPMMLGFRRWLRVLKNTPDPDLRLRCREEIYKEMPASDFSRDFLSHITENCVVFPLLGIQWNDWGQAQRIRDSLASIGKTPSFDPAADTQLVPSALLSSALR